MQPERQRDDGKGRKTTAVGGSRRKRLVVLTALQLTAVGCLVPMRVLPFPSRSLPYYDAFLFGVANSFHSCEKVMEF